MDMRFELNGISFVWDQTKARTNLRRHRIAFEEAASCLLDPEALVRIDPDAEYEDRFVLLGMSTELRLLAVCYAVGSNDTLRLISARKATAREARQYAKRV